MKSKHRKPRTGKPSNPLLAPPLTEDQVKLQGAMLRYSNLLELSSEFPVADATILVWAHLLAGRSR